MGPHGRSFGEVRREYRLKLQCSRGKPSQIIERNRPHLSLLVRCGQILFAHHIRTANLYPKGNMPWVCLDSLGICPAHPALRRTQLAAEIADLELS